MISSPLPTQESPDSSAPKPVQRTPLRKRPGESPSALLLKSIFRPFLKLFYYLLTGIRRHRIFTVVVILLLIGSISLTSFLASGSWPFGIGDDQFNFHIRGGSGGGEVVKNWLYALRSGDTSTIHLLDSDMSQPIDNTTLAQYVSDFSQNNARTWKTITVLKAYSQADNSVDSFVNVEYSADGPGGRTNGIAVWHFVTISQGRDYLLAVDLVANRRIS